jgi:hypothetical protein
LYLEFNIYVTKMYGIMNIKIVFFGGSKSKVIPLHALRGPEGSGRLRLPDFKTIGT